MKRKRDKDYTIPRGRRISDEEAARADAARPSAFAETAAVAARLEAANKAAADGEAPVDAVSEADEALEAQFEAPGVADAVLEQAEGAERADATVPLESDSLAGEAPIPSPAAFAEGESTLEHIELDEATVMAVDPHRGPRHKVARIVGIIAGVLIALGAIGGAAAYITYSMGMWGDVELPDAMGLSEAEARTLVGDAGFEVETFLEKADEGYGTVVSMDPQAGESVRHGSLVRLGIGEERIMPDVVGQKPDDASKLIEAEGLKGGIEIEYRVSVDAAEDTIIESDPVAGSVFRSDDTVTLYVARALKVPDVKGMQQDEAVAAIEELGLYTQVEWRESSELYPTALETDPLPGTRVEEGSTVTVYVANGGPEDRWHLTGYLDSSSYTDAEYLTWQQWEYQYSSAEEGYIYNELWSSNGYNLYFGSDPWAFSSFEYWNAGYADSALYADASFDAVRMEFTDLSEGSVDEKTVQRYMELCGFDNPQDTCTDKDISLPNKKAFDSGGVSRVCTYGSTDGYTWVILLKGTNDGAVDVSLVAMNDSAVSRLTADGGSACDMFMYRDAYPNGDPEDESAASSEGEAAESEEE